MEKIMTMVFEVYVIFFLFSLKALFEKKNISITKFETVKYIPFLLALILIAGLRDKNLVKDYDNYECFFNENLKVVEPTFLWITYFVKNVIHGSIKSLMIIYAFLSIFIKWIAIEEYSSYPALSFIVFIGDLFLLHECTQIRAGVAVSILLLSLKSIYNKNFKKYCFFVLVASLFHISSLLMIPLYFLNPKKINRIGWLCFICFGYILVIFHFDLMSLLAKFIGGYIGKKLVEYTSGAGKESVSANVFSIYTLSKLLILLVLYWKIDIVKKVNKYAVLLVKIQSISIFFLCFFAQNLAASLRISEFYTVVDILLFPLVVSTIKEKTIARILLICLCVGMLTLRIFRYNLILL